MISPEMFNSPYRLMVEAQRDKVTLVDFANKIFRNALLIGNFLAKVDAKYFVLSVGGNDGRVCVADSFDTPEEAAKFALEQTKEARLWSDNVETTTRYYPFKRCR